MKIPFLEIPFPSALGYLATTHRFVRGHKTVLHWHDFHELELVCRGGGRFSQNGREGQFSRGTCWLVGGVDCHSLFYEEDTEIANISFYSGILPESLAETVEVQTSLQCHFPEAETAGMLREIKLLEGENEKLPFAQLFGASVLTQCLIPMVRQTQMDKIETPQLVRAAARWANRHFHTGASLAELAEELSVSPNHLGKVFRRTTGMAFSEYVARLRLKRACLLLTGTQHSIKEIAFASGFRSVEYFHAVFRKGMRLTPAEYRDQGLNAHASPQAGLARRQD